MSNRSVNFVKPPDAYDDISYDSDDEATPCRSTEKQLNRGITDKDSLALASRRSGRSLDKNTSRKRKRAQSQLNSTGQPGISGATVESPTQVIEIKRSRLDNYTNEDTSNVKRRRERRKKRKNYSHPQRNKSRIPIETVTGTASTESSNALQIELENDRRSSVSNKEDFEFIGEFNNLYASARLFEQPPNGLRPIVIDGCNVAWGHGNDQQFSYKGLVLCADYFRARGHRHVKVFVPRNHQPNIPKEVVDELIRDEILIFTPSRHPGKQGKRITSYDDRFIVQYAVCTGGVVISNDNFNDLFDEQPTWRDTITNRVLQHTWVSKDILMFPLDPMGRRGKQTLNDFLRFPKDIAPDPSCSVSKKLLASSSCTSSASSKSSGRPISNGSMNRLTKISASSKSFSKPSTSTTVHDARSNIFNFDVELMHNNDISEYQDVEYEEDDA